MFLMLNLVLMAEVLQQNVALFKNNKVVAILDKGADVKSALFGNSHQVSIIIAASKKNNIFIAREKLYNDKGNLIGKIVNDVVLNNFYRPLNNENSLFVLEGTVKEAPEKLFSIDDSFKLTMLKLLKDKTRDIKDYLKKLKQFELVEGNLEGYKSFKSYIYDYALYGESTLAATLIFSDEKLIAIHDRSSYPNLEMNAVEKVNGTIAVKHFIPVFEYFEITGNYAITNDNYPETPIYLIDYSKDDKKRNVALHDFLSTHFEP